MDHPTAFPVTPQQRLEFARALVRDGRLTDGEPERCGHCARPLVYTVHATLFLLGRGLPNNPIRCGCGFLSIPSEGRMVPPTSEVA